MGTKADLHIHSKYSEHPSEWFLQRIGAAESYSEPENIYKEAKRRGMDFVTITDHNKIEGARILKENHPEDCFLGVEATAYFPEDGCKVHLLCYDFTEKQFENIQDLRKDIYELRQYLSDESIIHSVAHLNYSVNGKLKLEHIEKLLLMFDVFEGINGGRSKIANNTVTDVLKSLTTEKIEELRQKYGIEPSGGFPWIKGFTGGSNDHAALFIGRSYTESKARTLKGFLSSIAEKKTEAKGRSNDFTSLLFTIYKVAWDYSKEKSNRFTRSIFSDINAMIFESKPLGLVQRLKLKGYNITLGEDNILAKKVIELIEKLDYGKKVEPERRFDMIYDSINGIIDKIMEDIIQYFLKNTKELNLQDAIAKLSSLLPAAFLGLPFITTFNLLFKDRDLIRKMRRSFDVPAEKEPKKILWFSDTVVDLNGVSATLQELSWHTYNSGKNIRIVCSFDETENKNLLPPNILELRNIFTFKAPYYEKITFKIPSLLEALKLIYDEEPDEIFLSTPGFIGITGFLAAKLLHVPTIGIFHSDFQAQLDKMTDDNSTGEIVGSYIHWFYNNIDIIAVPTVEYKEILENYGFSNKKILLFPRWINTYLFKPDPGAKQLLQEKTGVSSGPVLLYTGRISKDKNLDLLLEAFKELRNEFKDINLIYAGDGPYYNELKKKSEKLEGVFMPGRIDRFELAKYYPGADIFTFPSATDTFGMSVLEAQSCGLPCLVSDVGGPKEIIIEGKSGYALSARNVKDWIEKITEMLKMKEAEPDKFQAFCDAARKNASDRFGLKNYEPGSLQEIH